MLTAVSTSLAHPLCGRSLALAAATASSVERVVAGAADELAILPPIHLSEDDSYLVVPGATAEIDLEPGRVRGILAGAVVVLGELSVRPRAAVLSVARRFSTKELFEQKPFDVVVPVRSQKELLDDLELPVARPAKGRLFDRRGLDRIFRSPDFVGKSWELDERGDVPDPTWAWSRRGQRTVNVHLMIFGDYEERYALINPVQLLLPRHSRPGNLAGKLL